MAAYPLSESIKHRWLDHEWRYATNTLLRGTGAYVEDEGWDEDLRDIESTYLGDGIFLVGFYCGRLVAMGAFRKTGPRRAEIKRMRVEPGFQGRGFGQAMLSALEGHAAEKDYTTLHPDTTVQQRAARRLYERNGYREADASGHGP